MRRHVVLLLVVPALLLACAAPAATQFPGRTYTIALTGAAERPDPGDPDGIGSATITVNVGRRTVCWTLTASGIAPATAAHIHVGSVDEAGGVVVPLSPPTSGESSGCATADRDLLRDLLVDPDGYYVNVHNADFPAGALRGQLSRR